MENFSLSGGEFFFSTKHLRAEDIYLQKMSIKWRTSHHIPLTYFSSSHLIDFLLFFMLLSNRVLRGDSSTRKWSNGQNFFFFFLEKEKEKVRSISLTTNYEIL